jgi:hypothetical protein
MVAEFLVAALLPPSIIAGALLLERVEERLGRPVRDARASSEPGAAPSLGPASPGTD